MKERFFNLMSCCLTAFVVSSAFAEDLTDKATGATFPTTVTFDESGKNYKLQATGVATRKKLIISVYSIASYLEEGVTLNAADKFQGILEPKGAKQLTMKWARNVPSDKIRDAYQDSFKTVLSEQDATALKDQVSKFVALFSADAQKGDEYILRWVPPAQVDVLINGKQAASFTNEGFARGLWSIWFGSKSVVNRDQLVSLIK